MSMQYLKITLNVLYIYIKLHIYESHHRKRISLKLFTTIPDINNNKN